MKPSLFFFCFYSWKKTNSENKQGTADTVYSVANAQEEIKLFTRSSDAKLQVVEGGQHFLSASKPKEVDAGVLEFIKKHSNK